SSEAVISRAAPTASTARPYRQMKRNIEPIILWPFYLTKKESLNFSRGKGGIAWSNAVACRFHITAWSEFLLFERRNHEEAFQCCGGGMFAEFVADRE